jgi:hypothetical protein
MVNSTVNTIQAKKAYNPEVVERRTLTSAAAPTPR